MIDSELFLATDSGAAARAFAAFVPPLVCERLAGERPAFGQPFASEFEGAVLITDISGFTNITERLDAGSADGVERLSTQLNAYFSRLIDLVETHGGLVAKFAGDALMAVWPASATSMVDAACSATACGWAIVNNTAGHGPAPDVPLALKASVGTGRIVHGILGGLGGRWLSMIGGEAIESARAAMQQCTSGAITLPPATIACAGKVLEVELLRDGFARISAHRASPTSMSKIGPAVMPDEAWLRGHIPTLVLDRITDGHAGWMAELRRVSVLFVHVQEAEFRGAPDLAAVQRAVTAIQTEIARCGGAIDDTGEDHGGLVVVAAFGLPGETHEDGATRAGRAALNISATLRAAVGVCTGRVFCGAIGSSSLRSYSMVGDTMNCAERLMRLAGSGVLCDEATSVAASRHLHFDYVRSEVLQGRQGAVAMFRPSDRLLLPAVATGMIGRDDERRMLRQRSATLAVEGCGGALIIEGEAGIGKSTLLAELRAAAVGHGIRLLEGSADAIDLASTYYAWRSVFQAVIAITADMDAEARATQLLNALASVDQGGESRLAPLLNPIFETNLPDNEITTGMAAQSRSEAVTRVLERLLQDASAATPMIIVLEDCHWLDSASLNLALALVRSVPRLLIAMVTRPLAEDASATWLPIQATAGGDHLRLGPLSPNEVAELAARRLGAIQIDAALAQFVTERGGGNPFFTEEICHALRDGNFLRIESGHCSLASSGADSTALKLPDTVQGVVSARIDRLSARERLAMKVASVNGRLFTLRMLGAVHPVESDRMHIQHCVRRLVALDFVMPLGPADGDAFEFKHSIVLEVAYGQLTFSQRHELHRRVAAWIELEQPSELALLARHWTEAAVPERAIHYLGRAGDEAVRRFANREADGFLTRAIELAASSKVAIDPLTRGRWHRQLGEAQFHLGHIDRCRESLCTSTRALGWPMPEPRRLNRVALPLAIIQQAARRLHLWRTPPVHLDRRELLAEVLNAYGLLGELAFFTNDLPASVFCLFHGANLAEKIGVSPKLAELFSGMTIVTGAVSPRIGSHYKRLTEQILAQFDAPVERGYAHQMLGLYLGGRGETVESQRLLEDGAAIFRRYGNGRRLEETLLSIIYPLLHRGEYERCAAFLHEMQCSAEGRGDTQTLGWVRILRTQLILALRGPQAALDVMGHDFVSGVDTLTRTALHASAAVAHWRLGDGVAAWKHAEAALQRCESRRPVAYVMLLYTSYVAEVFLGLLEQGRAAAGEQRALRDLCRRACAAMQCFARAFPVGTPRAAVWTGLSHWIRTDRATARMHWQRALASASSLGMLPDLALAHCHLARSDGDVHLAQADALYGQLQAASGGEMIHGLLCGKAPSQHTNQPQSESLL